MSRWLLRLWGRDVPLLHRRRWVEEWEAELQELERRLSERPAAVRWWTTTRFAFGARSHAAALTNLNGKGTRRMTMMTLGRDLRFAARSFRRAPGFTAVAILTLALGIGATTTMFSVLDGVLLRPLPYEAPDELVMVGSTSQRMPGLAPVAPGDFQDWRSQNTTFAEMVATEAWTLDLIDGDAPARVPGAAVTANFFEMLGAQPLLGQTIGPTDDVEGAEPVVVLSHGLWERRYGADPSIVGSRVQSADETFTVVGVMGASFSHPEALWSDDAELWIPAATTTSDMQTRNGRFLQVMGRLASGVTLFQARQEMTAISRALTEQYPNTNTGRETLIEPLQSETVGDVGQALVLLMGAVGMLLLIACVNVANLFMARAAERSREIAVRAALGAGGSRIRSQLLTEGVALSLAGGLAGVGLAFAGVGAFRLVNPAGIPRIADVTVDGRILIFALTVSVLTGIAFALVPALRLGRPDALDALKDGGRGGSDGVARSRFRHGLVALELSLAVVLLVGAGLFATSFLRLRAVDPGFDVDGSVTMSMTLNSGYGTPEAQNAFYRQMVERFESIPGARSVAFTTQKGLGPPRRLPRIDHRPTAIRSCSGACWATSPPTPSSSPTTAP